MGKQIKKQETNKPINRIRFFVISRRENINIDFSNIKFPSFLNGGKDGENYNYDPISKNCINNCQYYFYIQDNDTYIHSYHQR